MTMSKHREINCPICPGPICELDGASEGTVYVLLLDGKHISPMEGASVYSTEEKALEAVSQFILEDIENGRYGDDLEKSSALVKAIEARDWGRMEEIHDAYWHEFASPDRFVIHECPVD
jgi:hypothetical protein